jgi:signal transduction histidine kinase
MSLRVRLTLWYVLVLTVGLGVFGAALLWTADRSARTSFERSLQDRAAILSGYVKTDPRPQLLPAAPNEAGGQLGEQAVWIRVVDSKYRPVASQGPPLAGVPQELLQLTKPGFHTLGNLIVLVRHVNGRGQTATIQLFATTDQIDTLHEQLQNAFWVVGGLTIIIATFAGLFLADRALRPVDRIIRVAQEIGAGDLSRRVGSEISSRRRKRRSRDEITRLTSTIDDMLARLEEADERRRRLTADAAHELSTPVASMTTGAEIALRRDRSPDEYRRTLAQIIDEGRHLERMVDDLLLLARADSGRLAMNHDLVELDDVCRHAFAGLQPLAEKKGIHMVLDLPPEPLLVLGDEKRLSQVVRNLLDNALRFTPPEGTVGLTARCDGARAGRGGLVITHVRDSGPGIPDQELDRVFERFHRVTPALGMRASGGSHGSGLGLAICKAIVEAHGGTIRALPRAATAREGMEGGADLAIELPEYSLQRTLAGVSA